MNISVNLSTRVICDDKGTQTAALSQNGHSSYSSVTSDEGTSLADKELTQKTSHESSDAPTNSVVSLPAQNCGNCNAKFSQILCLLAIMWNQSEYLRKNSWLANTQRAIINHDHTYSKARRNKPKVQEEVKEEVPVLPPPNNIIFSEEEIEVCETIDVWNCDAAFEVSPQATPVMKTPSSDTLILPIKVNLKPGRDENSKVRPISKITETVQQVQHCTSTPSEGLHNNKRNSKKGT